MPLGLAVRCVCEHTFAMPWQPSYTEDEARAAIAAAGSWIEVLKALGINYHGRNIATVRRWAAKWGISVDHLSDGRGVRRARYSDEQLRQAVSASLSWAETLRRLGYCPTGGNWRTLKKRTAALDISTAHFDPGLPPAKPSRNARCLRSSFGTPRTAAII